jgi:murein L,D-transpeptidase YcbB/YkuD
MAGFELAVVEDGWAVMAMKVVVGRPYRRTPVFSGRMTYLVVNPAWNVPSSIAERDYLPKLRKDPRKVVEQQIRVFDSWNGRRREVDPLTVDWSRVSAGRFPYSLRQDPGHRNALGRIKFMLPNRFSVYLHDTPAVHLFDRQVRSFSSGCIRLERPFALADYLLKDDGRWTSLRLEEEIASGRTTDIALPQAIPVHFTYATAWADEEGRVQFRGDVYERDALLRRALFGG